MAILQDKDECVVDKAKSKGRLMKFDGDEWQGVAAMVVDAAPFAEIGGEEFEGRGVAALDVDGVAAGVDEHVVRGLGEEVFWTGEKIGVEVEVDVVCGKCVDLVLFLVLFLVLMLMLMLRLMLLLLLIVRTVR